MHRKYSEPGRWLHRSRWRGGQKSFWIPLFCYFPTDCCSWKSASPWKRLFNYGHNNDHFTVLFLDIYLYNDSVILSPLNKRHPQPVVNIRISSIADRIAFPVVPLFRVGKVSLHPACNVMLIMHSVMRHCLDVTFRSSLKVFGILEPVRPGLSRVKEDVLHGHHPQHHGGHQAQESLHLNLFFTFFSAPSLFILNPSLPLDWTEKNVCVTTNQMWPSG